MRDHAYLGLRGLLQVLKDSLITVGAALYCYIFIISSSRSNAIYLVLSQHCGRHVKHMLPSMCRHTLSRFCAAQHYFHNWKELAAFREKDLRGHTSRRLRNQNHIDISTCLDLINMR